MEYTSTTLTTAMADFTSPYEKHIKRFPRAGQLASQEAPFILLIDGIDSIQNAPLIQPSLSHPLVRKILETSDLPHLELLIATWHSTLSPPPGPPGFEIYALESVFYNAIRTNQAKIVEYFLDHGIRMCKLATWQAVRCQPSKEIWKVFLARGWDANDGRATYTGRSPLWLYPLLM